MKQGTLSHPSRLYREALAAYLNVQFPDMTLTLCRGRGLLQAPDMPDFPLGQPGMSGIAVSAYLNHIWGRAEPFGEVPGVLSSLTRREEEVLRHLAQGQSNKDIARALDLQVVTVKLHVRGICRKLGAANRTQAALMAHEKSF